MENLRLLLKLEGEKGKTREILTKAKIKHKNETINHFVNALPLR